MIHKSAVIIQQKKKNYLMKCSLNLFFDKKTFLDDLLNCEYI